jgi:hypothetical protein
MWPIVNGIEAPKEGASAAAFRNSSQAQANGGSVSTIGSACDEVGIQAHMLNAIAYWLHVQKLSEAGSDSYDSLCCLSPHHIDCKQAHLPRPYNSSAGAVAWVRLHRCSVGAQSGYSWRRSDQPRSLKQAQRCSALPWIISVSRRG